MCFVAEMPVVLCLLILLDSFPAKENLQRRDLNDLFQVLCRSCSGLRCQMWLSSPPSPSFVDSCDAAGVWGIFGHMRRHVAMLLGSYVIRCMRGCFLLCPWFGARSQSLIHSQDIGACLQFDEEIHVNHMFPCCYTGCFYRFLLHTDNGFSLL